MQVGGVSGTDCSSLQLRFSPTCRQNTLLYSGSLSLTVTLVQPVCVCPPVLPAQRLVLPFAVKNQQSTGKWVKWCSFTPVEDLNSPALVCQLWLSHAQKILRKKSWQEKDDLLGHMQQHFYDGSSQFYFKSTSRSSAPLVWFLNGNVYSLLKPRLALQ